MLVQEEVTRVDFSLKAMINTCTISQRFLVMTEILIDINRKIKTNKLISVICQYLELTMHVVLSHLAKSQHESPPLVPPFGLFAKLVNNLMILIERMDRYSSFLI